MNINAQLKQRSDYTHKYNIHSDRHGWLRLTPAYSVKMVEELLSNHKDTDRVLDPFCGSGTTALSASRMGFSSATTDINPFLVWLANVKTKEYTADEIIITLDACEKVLKGMGTLWEPAPAPPIHNIERWWSQRTLVFLCDLKGAIEKVEAPDNSKDLLLVAFCRTLIQLSNAAFNHQSMSFKKDELDEEPIIDRKAMFRENVANVISSCDEKISSQASVFLQDARFLEKSILGNFDLVITSPPYANRMSYIRELRPYMYWLGYLQKAREAGELDWQAIGGTWGIATSRLNEWQANGKYKNEHLFSVVRAISETDNKHAETLSQYVHKYHEDIYDHLFSLSNILNRNARVHYIIGNSTFYGTLVRVEEIYADIMNDIGFRDIDIKPIRKRNSKKELVEFDVSATW